METFDEILTEYGMLFPTQFYGKMNDLWAKGEHTQAMQMFNRLPDNFKAIAITSNLINLNLLAFAITGILRF